MKTILAVLVMLLVFGGIRALSESAATRKITPRQVSKPEYVEIATKNCAEAGNPESYCRCFYTEYLENHTVSEVLAFDNAAATQEPTQEQRDLAVKCLE